MPDCRTVGELMELLREFPENMPIFNGVRHVHAQAATAVLGPYVGRKVLYLTFADTPAEGNCDAAYARILEATGCEDMEELAGTLDMSPACLSGDKRRGVVGEPQRRLKRVELLCRRFYCGRGVWKQIDENRELLEFLLEEAPELMERAPFIEMWIGDTDIFLECLVELLELEMPEGALPFPRSWPGRCLHADAVEQSIEDWAERIRRLEQKREK